MGTDDDVDTDTETRAFEAGLSAPLRDQAQARRLFLSGMPKWSDDDADCFDDMLRAQRSIDQMFWR